MSAQLIDGRKIAQEIRAELRPQIEALRDRGVVPGLAMVLVGEDAASLTYVEAKTRACQQIGFHSETLHLSGEADRSQVLSTIQELNEREDIHGVLVHQPLPSHLEPYDVIESVSPEKDVEGLHPINVGRMVAGQKTFLPCTPAGIQQLLLRTGNDPGGKDVVILGRSSIVGRPLANLLIAKSEGANATVTVCHTGTADRDAHCRRADILVVAMGKPEAVDGHMVKPGAVVIDVGVHRQVDRDAPRSYRLVGDVDFPSVQKVASWITPVPGGVGPMTITMLLVNTLWAAQRLVNNVRGRPSCTRGETS